MFGYVIVNKDELKIHEFREYRSYYCGLCHALGEQYGMLGRFSVNYDVTFLAVLLTGLYEPKEELRQKRCIAHPLTASEYRSSSVITYAAHMNALLAYYKGKDDYQDERKRLRGEYAHFLGTKGRVLAECYPDKCRVISVNLRKLAEMEAAGMEALDEQAGYFGEVLRCIFQYREDEWKDELGEVGYHLGKFIYLLDAYEDREEDRKKGNYNPLNHLAEWSEEAQRQYVTDVLCGYAADCARAFEGLPIIRHGELLRNILYAGIWSVYNGRCKKNMKPVKPGEENHERSLRSAGDTSECHG